MNSHIIGIYHFSTLYVCDFGDLSSFKKEIKTLYRLNSVDDIFLYFHFFFNRQFIDLSLLTSIIWGVHVQI